MDTFTADHIKTFVELWGEKYFEHPHYQTLVADVKRGRLVRYALADYLDAASVPNTGTAVQLKGW